MRTGPSPGTPRTVKLGTLDLLIPPPSQFYDHMIFFFLLLLNDKKRQFCYIYIVHNS